MKVLIYSESQKMLKKSGIGRAYYHQQQALKLNNIEYTLDPKDSFDVVHINTVFKKSYKFMKKMQKKNIPVVVHGHSTVEDFRNSFRCWKLIAPWFKKCLFRMYSNADIMVTPTYYSKRLQENYPNVNCEIIPVSNGIDLTRFNNNYTKEELDEVRQKYNLGNSKIVMGIGLFFERKGLHDFIEIAKSMPDVKFIWFGQKYKVLTTSKIVKAIKNKPDNMIFPGYVPADVISKMLTLSSCFFFPSYEETEGIVVLEALANKTPLLVRDIPVFDWIEKDKECLKGKDNEDFKNKIQYLIDNDNTEMVNNGYLKVSERSLDKVGKQLEEVYKKALALKGK